MAFGVAQDNLFGTGKSISARVSRSRMTNNASLSFIDLYFTPEGVSLGYDLYGKVYDPRKSSYVAPGLTDTSLTPLALEAAGLDMGEVFSTLVERARHRGH